MSSAIVLASNNLGKLAELNALLASLRLTIYPLSHFTSEAAREIGMTFHENAALKARFAARAASLPAVADDSGLEVDALNGAPGVFSARYAGEHADDAANNDKLLAALSGIPIEKRTARFRCVLAYVETEHSQPTFAEGVWHGRILEHPRGAHGFGYDPLFLPLDGALTAAEMGMERKNRLSHRGQALQALRQQLSGLGYARA